MKKLIKRKFMIFLILILGTFFIFANYQITTDKKSLTMKEAYNIANKAINKVSPQALLVSMISADPFNYKGDNNVGSDGTRTLWNLDFAVPNTSEHWVVFIRNNKVAKIIKAMDIVYDRDSLIDKNELTIDSKDALEIVKKEYIIKPGEIWAIGYHFSISKEANSIILDVICRDSADNFTRISVNLSTKQITDAIHKISIGGGMFKGNTNEALINNYDIDGISYITDNENNNILYAWGRKMINIIQYQPVILFKKDSDKTWNEIKYQNDIREIIPVSEYNFFIICEKNIYKFSSGNITSILDINQSILCSAFYNEKIVILTKSEIYISPNKGTTWYKNILPVVKDTTNINFSLDINDNNIYVSINNKIYNYSNKEWLEIINNDDVINDLKYIDNSIVYTTDKSINMYDINTNKNSQISNGIIIKKLIRSGQTSIYAISDERKLFKIRKEIEDNDWIIVNCKTKDSNGFITDALQIDKNTWYYSTISEAIWEKIK